ncbi:MAG: hypothetical protein R3B72_47580 [Polyangiaceae bacterium]
MLRKRAVWGALLVVLYVAVAALRADPGRRMSWLAAALGAFVVLVGFRLTRPPARGVDRALPAARAAARVVVLGTALVAVASLAPEALAFAAVERLGVGLAAVASLVALVRVDSEGGIAAIPRRPPQAPALVTAALWLGALLAVAGPWVRLEALPVEADFAFVAACLASVAITIVTALRLYALRRFELGVAERVAAAAWLSLLAIVVAVFAALMSVAKPQAVVPYASLASSLLVTVAAVSRDPTRVSRGLRSAAALTLLCAPLASLAVVVAYKAPTHAGLVLFVTTIAAALLGLLSQRVALRLAPERGQWLRVLDQAIEAAKEPDPRQAVVEVLRCIVEGLGDPHGRPALYRLASGDRVTTDRAGYLHTDPESVPTALVDLVAEEPEQVLATEALRAVQVQRPEVRELVSWLDVRGAGLVALVFDEDVCVGMLLWPAAGRGAPLSQEEVLLARRLAAHLGAVTGAAAQLARSRARELAAEQAVREVEGRVERLTEVIERQTRRQRALAERMAKPAEVACYSAAAQTARLAAEDHGRDGRPLTLVAPLGVDPMPWAATIHLVSERAQGPLLVVDGAAPEEHDIASWQDPQTSPLEVARDGTLVVVEPQALPADTQRYLATALPEDTGLVLVVSRGMTEAEVQPELSRRVGARRIDLPTLAQRAEDLRALALHELSRIGVRLRGEPLGLSLAGQQAVNEHVWPGNDAELQAVLLRAALATSGRVVDGPAVLAAIGEDSPRSGSQRASR